jgi:hypothetical protein
LWAGLLALVLTKASWSDALKGEARQLYQQGKRQFAAKHFKDCAESFVHAYELASDPHLLWNAAACQRQNKEIARAESSVERYLASAGLSPKELSEAGTTLAALKKLLGQVRLRLPLPEQRLVVDGEPARTVGAGPLDLWLDPGKHVLEVSAAGRIAETHTVEIRAQQQLEWAPALAEQPEPEPPTPVTPRAAEVPSPPVATASPPAVEAPAPAPAPSRSRAPWVVAGVGVAAGIASAVLLVHSRLTFTALSRDCAPLCAPSAIAVPRGEERIGWSLVAVASAALVAAIVWWVVQ